MMAHFQKQPLQTIKAFALFVVLCFFIPSFSVSATEGGTPEASPEFVESVGELLKTDSNKDFGQTVINWIAFGKPSGVAFGDTSLLSTVSFTLNALALVMMAYLSMLGGLTYIIQTANKGTPGGQVVSSFWMPIRIASATILLIPLASGYSTIQYGVIKVAEKGNSHGSYLMDQGIDYIAENGVYRPPMMESNREAVAGLIMSELCRKHINTKEGDGTVYIKKKVDILSPVKETLRYSYDKTHTDTSFFRGATTSEKVGYCGELTLLTPDADVAAFMDKTMAAKTSVRLFGTADYEDDAGILATAKLTEFIEKTLIPEAKKIADKLSDDSVVLRSLQTEGGGANQTKYEKAREKADKAASGLTAEYNALVAKVDKQTHKIIQESVMAINKHNTTSQAGVVATNESAAGTPRWVKEVKEAGWPALGAVFWQISKNQEAVNYLAQRMKLSHQEPKIDPEYKDDERYAELFARHKDLLMYSKEEKTNNRSHVFEMSAVNMAGADGSAGYFKSLVAGMFQSLMGAMFIPNDDGDLITKLQYSGSVLAATTDMIFHSSVILKAGAKTAVQVAERTHRDLVDVARSVPLVGSLTGAAASIGATLVSGPWTFLGFVALGYGEFVGALILPLMLAGFALAVVLPAIPLFFWLMGVISWMLFFVECLLVSPMWLAAHGTAEKDGWGTEHTRQGYMLMIGLYLNPILRVAGFFAIFLVLIPLGKMTGWLAEYLTGVLASGWLSPVMIVGGMVIMAVFAYSAAVRVFSLPNELFERGLRWVNGGQEVTGDSSAEQQNRMIIAQVGGKAEGAASSARHLSRGVSPFPQQSLQGSTPKTPTPN